MKIIISVPVSDWFEDKEYELDTTKFSHYKLVAYSLLWTLECYAGFGNVGEDKIDHYELAPSQNIYTLIKELNIRAIESYENARPIKGLFINIPENFGK